MLIPRHEKFVSAGVADGGQRDGETFLMEKATNIDFFDSEDLVGFGCQDCGTKILGVITGNRVHRAIQY